MFSLSKGIKGGLHGFVRGRGGGSVYMGRKKMNSGDKLKDNILKQKWTLWDESE